MLGIYTRISGNKEDGKDTSIEIQTELGIAFAKRMGLPYKVYTDIGISGAKDEIEDRPEFALLLDDIKKDIITGVWVLEQARLERSPSVWQLFQLIAIDKETKYYPNSVETDLSDPMIQFSTGILSLVNRLYSQLTRQKVNYTFDKRASEGLTHGLTPYGYDKGADGKFEINEFEADVVRRIFALSLEGNGTYTIANILNEEGVKTKYNKVKTSKKVIKRKDSYTGEITTHDKSKIVWRGNVIYDMLRNTTYKGQRTWNKPKRNLAKDKTNKKNKTVIQAEVPPIVSAELWDSVNRNLVNNKKNVGRRSEFKYLLNGLITCGFCGKEYRGKKRISNKDSAYKCVAVGKCKDSRGISIIRFENFIINHLFLNKNLKELIADLPINEEHGIVLKQQLKKNEDELEKKVRLKNRYLDWQEDETASNDADLLRKFNEVIRDIDNIKFRIDSLKQQIVESDFAKVKFDNAIKEYKLTTSFDDTKKLIHSLVERIKVNHKKLKRGGVYFIEIKYKGFEEVSLFTTDWLSVNWDWISYYRNKATTSEQLAEDIEDLKALYEFKDIKLTDDELQAEIKAFEGFESVSSMHDTISLDKENLVIFN